MARRFGDRHPRRDGPHQPGAHRASQGVGRTVRNPDAGAGAQGRRPGAGRESASGEDGIFMEVKAGYKWSEVGVIPEDWEVKPLHALADKIMVGIASAATYAYRKKGIVLF